MTIVAFSTDHTLRENEVAIKEAPVVLRSCLKTRNNDSDEKLSAKKKRRVRMSKEMYRSRAIYSLKEWPLWSKSGMKGVQAGIDKVTTRTNTDVQDYIDAADAAYEELNDTDGAVSEELRKALIGAVARGYRSLENYSEGRGERFGVQDDFRAALVSKYRLAAVHRVDWSDEAAARCATRSRAPCQWAAYMGQIDAAVARKEYATLPHSLRPPSSLHGPVLYRQPHVRRETAAERLDNEVNQWPFLWALRSS